MEIRPIFQWVTSGGSWAIRTVPPVLIRIKLKVISTKSLASADLQRPLGRYFEPPSNFSQTLVNSGFLGAWKTAERS
jgi:hypothetical protein